MDSMSHRPRHMLPKCSSLGAEAEAGMEGRGLALTVPVLMAIVYRGKYIHIIISKE